MMKWEMTYKQFCEDWLENCKYKQSYLNDNNKWEGKKENLKVVWEQVLLEKSEEGTLPTDVIMSYIRLFGENTLFRVFKGVYGKGIIDFRIPKSVRDIRRGIN